MVAEYFFQFVSPHHCAFDSQPDTGNLVLSPF